MMNRRAFLAALVAGAGQALLPRGAWSSPPASLLRVAVISDLNHSYGTIGYDPPIHRAIRRIIELRPDLVLCTGDMIAGQRTAPKLKRKQLESMWRSFIQTVVHPLDRAEIPLAAAPGNHDASASPGFQLERRVYREQWSGHRNVPALRPGGNFPFWYGFDLDGVLFLSLDLTVTSPMPGEQKKWLTRELARSKAYKAVIAFGHIPFFPLTVGREQSFVRDPDLEKLLIQAGVDLYLSGHHHAFYPFYHNGLHCIGQAALGSGPRRLIGSEKRSPRAFTLLDIFSNGTVKATAWTGPQFRRVLSPSRLPARITTRFGTVLRDDLQ